MTIQELLDQHGIDYRDEGHEHCRPGWRQYDCPQCSADWKHYRLGLNLRRNYFACWSCGGVGTLRTLHLLTNVSYKELKEFNFGRERVLDEEDVRGKLVLPDGHALRPCHVTFLQSRGFNARNTIQQWGLSGTGELGTHRWRIVIPIVYQGQVVSFTTRAIDESQSPRYLSAAPHEERLNHRHLLYGHDLACGSTVIVVEGPLDVWAVGPGCVATFGTAITPAQVRKLARYPRVVTCFDNEPNAQTRARRLAAELSAFGGEVLNVVMETGKDPSRADKAEVAELRRMLNAHG